MSGLVTGGINFGPPPSPLQVAVDNLQKKKCFMGRHAKVYANYELQTYPPQKPWICSICGEEGTDVDKIPELESYYDIKKRFGKS